MYPERPNGLYESPMKCTFFIDVSNIVSTTSLPIRSPKIPKVIEKNWTKLV